MAKKKRQRDTTASTKDNDKFIMLYNSLLTSKAYQELTPTAKVVYLYCRNQASCERGRANLYKYAEREAEIFQDNNLIAKYMSGKYFTMPEKHTKEVYGMAKSNMKRYLDELIKHGFIKRIKSNEKTWKQNLYCFSDEWSK